MEERKSRNINSGKTNLKTNFPKLLCGKNSLLEIEF